MRGGEGGRGGGIVNSKLDETAERENIQDLNAPNRNILLFFITAVKSHSLLLARSSPNSSDDFITT